jgi:CelD/BcsL family acetyltransferase involved in cellulose biosynthesis
MRAWLNRPGSRVFDLRGLVEDSALKAALDTARVTRIDVAPWEPLPGGMSAYLGARSPGFRRQARTTSRRLAELGVQHHQVTAREFDLAMRDFRALHATRGDRADLLAQLPRLENALAAGLACGEIKIHVLRAGSVPVAVSLSFLVADRLSLYQSARSFEHKYRNATQVLELEVISQGCAAGCREVDLLRGGEPYKASYASRRRQIYRLRAAHGILGHLYLALSLGVDHLRNLVHPARRAWDDHRDRDREDGTRSPSPLRPTAYPESRRQPLAGVGRASGDSVSTRTGSIGRRRHN